MRKFLSIIIACCCGISVCNAGGRPSQNTTLKNNSVQNSARQNNRLNISRTAKNNSQTKRDKKNIISRIATNNKNQTLTRSTVRSATTPTRKKNSTLTVRTATTNLDTLGTGYNDCRDAYFSCMDQFCANQNETYRRCICSSKLDKIKFNETKITNTKTQLQDFQDLNLNSIKYSATEVQAMLSATTGETAISTDKSDSASKLSGISSVLENTKKQALSTQGQMDIAGDINQIWKTTNLTSGSNISDLTGTALYNAVHNQCSEMVAETCSSKTTLNMVVSAYGMYIENDCKSLETSQNKQIISAQSSIRNTEKNMQTERLEYYNLHNSVGINDCIANVRQDITADTACGTNYIHCMDISGKYLNYTTGEPIYSSDFYQLETMLSLNGDVLTNNKNAALIKLLNDKKSFATNSLDYCRDISDNIWQEFLRQAITEIYQGQQERVRQVKNECFNVVNNCYDEKTNSLKDFSNTKEQLLLGSRLELSEELCQEKLNTCSNLYGGGTEGLSILVSAMHDITDQTIAKDCYTTILEYVTELCSPSVSDTIHSYPYACRIYAPGDQSSAMLGSCEYDITSYLAETYRSTTDILSYINNLPPTTKYKSCPANTYRHYTKCLPGYFLYNDIDSNTHISACLKCPTDAYCEGGTEQPVKQGCSTDYSDSLYSKLVSYAKQACIRPSISDSSNILSVEILADVNRVMDSIKTNMSKTLSEQCTDLGGTWISGKIQISSLDDHTKHSEFYSTTDANTGWGFCESN